MNKPEQRHARAWQLSSNILVCLAISAVTWVVMFIVWITTGDNSSDSGIAVATFITLAVFSIFHSSQWNSKGSSKLYTSELIIGGLFIIGGGIYAYYNYTLSKAHVSTGPFSGLGYMIMMVIGIYFMCIGTLTSLAGFLGMLSNPRIREGRR